MHSAQRLRRFPFGEKPHAIVVRHLDEVAETDSANLAFRPQRLLDEPAVGGEQSALAVDQRGHHPGLREPFADGPPDASRGRAERVGRGGPGKRHSSISPFDPDALDLDRDRPAIGRDPGDAAGAVAPGHRPGHVEALREPPRRGPAQAGTPRRSVRDRPH